VSAAGHRVLVVRPRRIQYVHTDNERNKPFRWTKTADEILDKMRRFGLRTQQAHGQDVCCESPIQGTSRLLRNPSPKSTR